MTIKDPVPLAFSEAELRTLQASITDPNFRIFADSTAITVFNNEHFVRGTDIQDIFAQLGVTEPTHAFYLGRNWPGPAWPCTLGKTYRQEGALSWGYLTPPDERQASRRADAARRRRDGRPMTRAGRSSAS